MSLVAALSLGWLDPLTKSCLLCGRVSLSRLMAWRLYLTMSPANENFSKAPDTFRIKYEIQSLSVFSLLSLACRLGYTSHSGQSELISVSWCATLCHCLHNASGHASSSAIMTTQSPPSPWSHHDSHRPCSMALPLGSCGSQCPFVTYASESSLIYKPTEHRCVSSPYLHTRSSRWNGTSPDLMSNTPINEWSRITLVVHVASIDKYLQRSSCSLTFNIWKWI